MKAIWNNEIIAESKDTIIVESNHYFPPNALKESFFSNSDTTSFCSWKGTAQYYDIIVNEKTNKDAAWYYAAPQDKAKNISGYVAFWKGVQVTN